MASGKVIDGGPTTESYSVTSETQKLLNEGILRNPLISKYLPSEAFDYANKVHYEGSEVPSIPINWRFAESVAALKGLEATLLNVLLVRKYGVGAQEVIINTDHAQLFILSAVFWVIDPETEAITAVDPRAQQYFPDWDIHRHTGSNHRLACTNIYKTKDGRFFHLHGSMNPDPSLDSLGLPHDLETSSMEASWRPFVERIAQIESEDIQKLTADVYKQAGTICYAKDEYAASEHGKANAHCGLFEIHTHPNSIQKPCWWPSSSRTGSERPLAGLKVLDITRIIAAPAITRGLAEMGASVMRVTAPHLADYSSLHCDMNWGKWNTCLDFREEAAREKMQQLILEADIVVSGYRPHVLDKWGFGREGIMKLCENRERGIIYARENCYGWNGPWAYRSGWQQISDACCGVSMEFGRAMGNNEPVTPVFPNSDYCTGVAGVSGILCALIQRAEIGGSYTVDIALNYYSRWLVDSCGVYPDAVWQDVWNRNGTQVFRHYHGMYYTLPRYIAFLRQTANETVMNPKWFEKRMSKNIGKDILTVKPVAQFLGGTVQLGYDVGTRTNGVDQPRWPNDLTVEVVNESN